MTHDVLLLIIHFLFTSVTERSLLKMNECVRNCSSKVNKISPYLSKFLVVLLSKPLGW